MPDPLMLNLSPVKLSANLTDRLTHISQQLAKKLHEDGHSPVSVAKLVAVAHLFEQMGCTRSSSSRSAPCATSYGRTTPGAGSS